MNFLSVKYDNNDKFAGFELSINDNVFNFDSGDMIIDCFNFNKHMSLNDNVTIVSFSSAYNHLFFDNKNIIPVYKNGIELIGNKKLNTFEKIKAYVKENQF